MKLFIYIFLFVQLSFAAEIITYIGESSVSQDDAGNVALSGIAKQIVANVSSSEKMTVEDHVSGSQSSTQEFYSSNQNVQSNISLKWAKIKTLPKKKNLFCAEATLDVSAVIESMELRMSELQSEISAHEKNGNDYLNNRLYKRASDELMCAIPKVFMYNEILDDLSVLSPLNKSLKLKHNLHDFEKQLISKLSSVKLELDESSAKYEKDRALVYIKVFDYKGAVSDYPISLYKGTTKVTTTQTQIDGLARFDVSVASTDLNSISVISELPEGLLKNTGLNQKISVHINADDTAMAMITEVKNEKKLALKCENKPNICNAVKDMARRSGIKIEDNPSLPELHFTFSANKQRELVSSEIKIVTYDFVLDFEAEDGSVALQKNVVSAGKTEEDALIKALKRVTLKSK